MLVGFDPASGHEQQGAGRPALVLSVQAFNQLGMTLVAPITQGGNFARYAGFSVPLHCEEGDVHGVVLVNQVRMRWWKRRYYACRRWWNKVCLFIAGIKKPLLTEARRSGLLR